MRKRWGLEEVGKRILEENESCKIRYSRGKA